MGWYDGESGLLTDGVVWWDIHEEELHRCKRFERSESTAYLRLLRKIRKISSMPLKNALFPLKNRAFFSNLPSCPWATRFASSLRSSPATLRTAAGKKREFFVGKKIYQSLRVVGEKTNESKSSDKRTRAFLKATRRYPPPRGATGKFPLHHFLGTAGHPIPAFAARAST